MTRRDLIWALSASALGQTPIRYRRYERCLPDALRGFAAEALRRRNSELLKVSTPESLRSRQIWARKTFWELIGGAPQRTPLNARVTGEFDRPKYKVEKLVYESRPGHPVTAKKLG